MQPKIDDHDLDFKSKHVKDFLNEGNKVKVTIRFKGRELAHTELGKVVLDDVLAKIEGEFVLDKPPTMEGKFMSMILSPKTVKKIAQASDKTEIPAETGESNATYPKES
jgi:translation initiation factor IF-3